MRKYPLIVKSLTVGIILLFVGTSTPVIAEPSGGIRIKTNKIIGLHDSSRDQVEIHYYNPATLQRSLGILGGTPPYIWKSAIRLTQTELAPYKEWNITSVVIGFNEDPNEGPMNITIYIYAKGTATKPGRVIVEDTWAILNGTRLITVPLKTPVSLSVAGREEVWVAVQWTQHVEATKYAMIDNGPAVDGKGDWIYLSNIWVWEEIQPSIDSNWALGAVVEGQNPGYYLTTIVIGVVKGVVGITAALENTGDVDAHNVTWSISVEGGFFSGVDKTTTGTDTILAPHQILVIQQPMFFGFGLITIMITAQAVNAPEVTAVKLAYSLGPFVMIK